MTDQKIASRILFVKSSNEEDEDITFDAINSFICNLDSCKELRFNSYYYINNHDEFMITDKIRCKLNKLELNDDTVNSYSLEVYSYELQLAELKMFINDLRKKYMYERNNKLDNLKYYFDEHHVSLMKNRNNEIKYSSAPNELTFTMTQFNTNKSLKNVFGNHLQVIKERMDLFTNNPEWYSEKGIPYTLGILLHGPPGTGKTSIIKAIAKDTNRHIFNIKLHSDTTKTQLYNLFFNETIKVVKNGKAEIFTIPLDERIYVLEDVDCDNDLLLDRQYKTKKDTSKDTTNWKHNYEHSFEARYEPFNPNTIDYANFQSTQPNKQTPIMNNTDIPEDTSEQLTLSFILNILDGILETPGRILIMTSNYPEKLDKALIRPGRIDINLQVGYCDIQMIKEMFKFFYNTDFNHDICIKNDITPAQLNKILSDNFNNPSQAVNEIFAYISN